MAINHRQRRLVQQAMRKRLPILLALLAVILAAAGGYRYLCQPNESASAVTLFGNVDQREVELAFMLQERITKVDVEEGDRVEAGQLLAELEPQRYHQTVVQREAELEAAHQQLSELEHGSRPEEVRLARAELTSAQAAEREAQLSYQRVKRLLSDKLTSPQQADDARAALDMARAKAHAVRERLALVEAGPRAESIALARARVDGAAAALSRARKDLDDTRLLAPAGGIIQARILEPGDLAGPQRPAFTLALLDPVWVRAYVSETELGRIHPGMPAEIRTDSYPDKAYHGRVGYISSNAEFTPKTVQTSDVRSSLVYQVRILVPDSQGELRMGMPATVTIPTPARESGDDAGS